VLFFTKIVFYEYVLIFSLKKKKTRNVPSRRLIASSAAGPESRNGFAKRETAVLTALGLKATFGASQKRTTMQANVESGISAA